MKTLKKLTLNKEEIVNLNDFEMRNLKGGTATITTSSEPCVAVLTAYTQQAAEYITHAIDNAYNHYTNNMGDTSRVVVYGGCLISGVTVRP